MNDKEGRKWLLKKLYDRGFKYIAFSKFYNGYVGFKEKPLFMKTGDVISGASCIITLGDLLPDFNEPNYLDIGKYLGIVDWSKVAVDTPIIVDYNDCKKNLKRHFSRFSNGNVYYFTDGKTSWTSLDETEIGQQNIRLAGGEDEN